MKRILGMLLVLVLLLGMLTACAGNEKPVSVQNQDNSVSDNEKASEKEAKVEVTLSETVVYDENDVRITAVALEEGWTGKQIKILVENNTDKNIALSATNVIVNGVSMYAGLYIDVAAGMKSYGTLDLYDEYLKTAGIEDVALIDAKDAYIYDTDTYDTLLNTPFVLETSLGSDFVQQLDESGDVIFESNGITVISKVITEEFYGKTVLLYVKNESEKNIIVEAENISVNGFTIDAWLYDTVYSETVRFCDLDLFSSGLEENGIEEIKDITFRINIIDSESYSNLAKSDTIQIFVSE